MSGSGLKLDAYVLDLSDNISDLSNNFANFLVFDADVSDNANIALSKLADVSGSGLKLDAYVLDLSANLSALYTTVDNLPTDTVADESGPGYVSIHAQTFAGAKTFKDVVTIDEHQNGTSYSPFDNAPIKPFLIIPNTDLSGAAGIGGAYYKYNLAETVDLSACNAFALVAQGIDANSDKNTSFYAELTYLAKSEINSTSPMTHTSLSTTTKLIITCTGVSVVNTVLGEEHASDNLVVTTHTQGDTFIVLINGIRFNSVLFDFYAANSIWKINSLDVIKTLTASQLATNITTYGFAAIV